MNTSKSMLIVSTLLGKFNSILGYFLTFFWVCFLGLTSNSDTKIVVLAFALIGVLLIISGAKTTKRIKRFKHYIFLIQNLFAATSQSTDFVAKDLQKMIDKKLFTNAYIDLNSGAIVVNSQHQIVQSGVVTQDVSIKIENLQCTGCGATNSKQKGVYGSCNYCGSPLV